jgi:hypothetical protein
MSDVKIVIGADVSDLNRKLTQAGNITKDFAGKVQTGSNQATVALTNLGRVVQDAPFGFIGIANNINPLLESFQRLQVEAGSSKAAFSALASGLIGAGGLGFAVSVVTSLLTAFTMNADSAGGSAKNLSAGLEPLANKIKETKKAEDDFKDATLDASTAVLQQTENLLALKNIYTSLAPEIDNVTASVIRQGTAQFLFDKKNTEIQKLLSQEIQREIDLRKKQRPFSGVQEYSSDLFSKDKLTRDIAETKDKIRQINDLSFGLEDAFKNLFSRAAGEGSKKKIRTITDVLKELDNQIQFLNNREILFLSSENKGKLDALGDALNELLKDFKLKPTNPIILDLKYQIDSITAKEELKTALLNTGLFSTDRKKSPLEGKVVVDFTPILNKPLFSKEIQALSQEATAIAQSVATQAFIGIGDAIGEAAAGNGNFFGNVFGAIFKALGAGIRQLGIYAITTSKLIVALKASIGTTLGIAGGVALVALGTLISAAASKIQRPKFATGVRNFEGGIATVGERGPETVLLPRGSSVVPNNEVMAYGGGGITLMPSIAYDGTQFRIFLNRVDAKLSRTG